MPWNRGPILCTTKTLKNQACFLSNFINLNKKLRPKPYPMSNISKMLLKLENFQYATSLDLNMIYCHIQIIENTNNLFSIISLGGNIVTNVYQWELTTHQTYSNIK